MKRIGVAVVMFAASASADDALPPWNESGDLPVPAWVRSVTANRADPAIYAEPGKLDQRRGTAQPGAHLPFFGTRRASGCPGRWLAVGPMAWICSDVAEFSPDEPLPAQGGRRPLPSIEPTSANDDGLPHRYYFAGRDGAYGFMNLQNALDDAPDQELEPGFAVAITEEQSAHGERWGKTKKGRWIAMRELSPAHPLLFHGELTPADGKLDVAWVVVDKAITYATQKTDKAKGQKVRFEKVKIVDDGGAVVKIDGGDWMKTKDLARPSVMTPPDDLGGAAATERWIDVDLAQQTLVAYEGARPVFSTLVSTGKGPVGSEFETRKGVHRIWVKVTTTKMDNLDKDDADRHYALEDVPWVQFFDKSIALHGVFWHRDFGHVHSHGCVNLTPLDARWLYAFTSPHLPAGWTAALPTKIEQGTAIRVR